MLRSNADIFEVGFLVMLVQTHVVSCRTLQPRPCVWTGLQKQKGGSHVDPVGNPLACPRGHLGLWGKRLRTAMNFCFFWYCVKRSDGHFNVPSLPGTGSSDPVHVDLSFPGPAPEATWASGAKSGQTACHNGRRLRTTCHNGKHTTYKNMYYTPIPPIPVKNNRSV